MELLRVLLVTEPSGGGSGRHFIDLAGELSSRGHEVSAVYSPLRAEGKFEAELSGLSLRAVERLPMRRAVGPWDAASALALGALVGKLGPFDVIHSHSSKAGALSRLMPARGAVRVYTPHAFRTMDPSIGRLGRYIFGGIEAGLARYATDAVVAVSEEEATHARVLGVPPGKIHTIVNGAQPIASADRQACRAQFGITEDQVAFGFVGRLHAQKDPVRFAAAIREASATDPRVRGVILGDGELSSQALAAGGGMVTIHSGLDARKYLSGFDIFALTSRYEAMPYVLIEALQAGLPIAASSVGGVSLTVSENVNGIVFPVDAGVSDVAEVFLKMIPSESRAKMASQSLKKSVGFSLSAMADRVESLYFRLVADVRSYGTAT